MLCFQRYTETQKKMAMTMERVLKCFLEIKEMTRVWGLHIWNLSTSESGVGELLKGWIQYGRHHRRLCYNRKTQGSRERQRKTEKERMEGKEKQTLEIKTVVTEIY